MIVAKISDDLWLGVKKLIELGNSWLSAKTIEVVCHMAGYPVGLPSSDISIGPLAYTDIPPTDGVI